MVKSSTMDLELSETNPNIELWAKYYHEDGNELISTISNYETFQLFEKDYFIYYGDIPLNHAIISNNAVIVRKLLLKGADPNVTGHLIFTPLYHAITIDSLEMVEILLTHGADAKGSYRKNDQDITYFHKVCMHSDWKIVKLFLIHGCNVNDILFNDHWESPMYFASALHLAVLHKRLKTINVLLSFNANVNDSNERGETPLHLACSENFTEAVELLLNKNALVNICANDKTSPLFRGLKNKNYKIVELLLANGAFIESNCSCYIYKQRRNTLNICEPLHEVIASGLLNIIELLLNNGLNVNMKCENTGSSLLHTAISSEQIEIVDLLLNYKANVNIKNSLGKTPLHIVADVENEVIMELLLQHEQNSEVWPENSNINSVDKQGLTPLHIACEGINIKCVQYLLDCGADINAESFSGQTPLYLSCSIDNVDVAKFLIRNKASVNVCADDNSTPLHIAVENGYERTVELLLMNEAITISQNSDQQIPLDLAIKTSNKKIIELLLQYNPDVNNEYYRKVFLTVLKLDNQTGSEIVECFFKYGFIMTVEDKNNYFVLCDIVENGYVNIVEQLIAEGINFNITIKGETLLHIATKNRRVDIVKLLVNNQIDVNVKDVTGKIPIHYAIENDDVDLVETFLHHGTNIREYPDLLHYTIANCVSNFQGIIEILLKYGADINYCDDHGGNILHLLFLFLRKDANPYKICKNIHPTGFSLYKIVEFLLNNGVNVNARTKYGSSALHMAIVLIDDNQLLIRILLKYDADVECRYERGSTPLHLCCQMGNAKGIDLLLKHGADINAEDDLGKTPMDIVFEIKETYIHQTRSQRYGLLLEMFYKPHVTNSMQDPVNGYFMMRNFIDFCSDAEDIFNKHLIKLKAARFYINPKNEKYFKDPMNFNYLIHLDEIENLKMVRINNYITVYDVLKKNLTEVARYTKNENLKNFHVSDFPLYGELIFNKLQKAVRRENIVNEAKEALNLLSASVVNGHGLPDACSENLTAYLTNDDLRNLINIFPSSMEVVDEVTN